MHPMTPTEALATALRTAYWSQWDEGTAPAAAEAILAHLPPGFALVSVEEVARRLWDEIYRGVRGPYYNDLPEDWKAQYQWIARRLLGLEPDR